MDKIVFPTSHLRKPTYSAKKRAEKQRKHNLKMNKRIRIMYEKDWKDLLDWINPIN
jgi:hypothetical protein